MENEHESLRAMIREEFAKLKEEFASQLEGVLEGFKPHLQPQVKREWWTAREVAEHLGIKDVETVRGWCKSLKINAHKTECGNWLIPNSELERLIKCGGKP